MTALKLVVIAGTLSLLAAGSVALLSRTPAAIRENKPDASATDPSLGASFTEQQVKRAGSYRGPGYLAYLFNLILPVVLLLLFARGPFVRLVDRVTSLPGGWPVHAVVLAVALTVALALVTLPLGYVRGYAMAHAWGLSTQDVGGWLSDQLRGVLVSGVIAAVAAVAYFGALRWVPDRWWLWGWGSFTVLTILLTFLFPLLIAPLFFKFTPLPEGELRTRVLQLASEAGIALDEVQVADASRRTTAENAYVAGIGASKQLVLYDTLLEAGSGDETAFVVAHELGHKVKNHIWKGIAASSLALFAAFAALYWLSHRPELWAWGGAEGPGDLRALPLLLLFVLAASVITTPLESSLSRHHEREADAAAIELTGDPDTAVRSFRRLAFSNLADLDPPKTIVWLLFSHPPIPERIEAALAGQPQQP
ncbi:MAG: M48 family metallopeptidase [Actinomycetota bacterium]